MITLYGIPNCNTIKKAKDWLSAENIDYQFHNFKKQGLEKQILQNWVNQVGWEILLNKRGTTWRKLADEDKNAIDEEKAINLMQAQPTLIKRPVLDVDNHIHVGFSDDQYQAVFK